MRSQNTTDATPSTVQDTSPVELVCSPKAPLAALRQACADEVGEREMDAHIASLAKLSEKAMGDGDPLGARLWAKRMHAAINSRGPDHQQSLHQRAWQRMLDADACYFSGCGERDRVALTDLTA